MLTVGISTSSGQFAVVIGKNNIILYNSSQYSDHNGELDDILSEGLDYCKKSVTDITRIVVDIGPGGTSRVRTGIAFANALAYSLGISVSQVLSVELAGIDAESHYGLPVIHSVKSIKGSAYVGLYHRGRYVIQYGSIHEIVPALAHHIDSFVVSGSHRETIMGLASLANKTMIDSGSTYGDASFLIEHSDYFVGKECDFPVYAQPVTEKTL